MLWADGCHTSQGFRKHSWVFQTSLLKTFPLPLLSSRENSKGQSGMVGKQHLRKGREDWLETLWPRVGTEAGVTSALWTPAADNPRPIRKGFAPGAFVPVLTLLFSPGKCPSGGKGLTQLYEGSSLTPAHNWDAWFATASNTNILFIAQIEYEENHYFSVLFLKLFSCSYVAFEMPNTAGRLARAWCSALRLWISVSGHRITHTPPACSLKDLLFAQHQKQDFIAK